MNGQKTITKTAAATFTFAASGVNDTFTNLTATVNAGSAVSIGSYTLGGGTGAGAELQVDNIFDGQLVQTYTFLDKFTDISHAKARILDDAVGANKAFIAPDSAAHASFTEGNFNGTAADKRNDITLSLEAATGFKTLGWANDSLPGRPAAPHDLKMDTATAGTATVALNTVNTYNTVSSDGTADYIDTITNEAAPASLAAISHTGEGAFYAQAGRRLTGRTKTVGGADHNTPSFGDDAANTRFDTLRLVKAAGDMELVAAKKGAGYTQFDLIDWKGILIQVDTLGAGGAIATWSLKRDHVYATPAQAAAVGGSIHRVHA